MRRTPRSPAPVPQRFPTAFGVAALASLLLFLAAARFAAAEEPSPGNAPPDRASAAEEPLPGRVLDTTHEYLEQRILGLVVRFDEFFGSVKNEDLRRPAFQLRWRNALRWEEGGRFKYRTSVRAHLRLPAIGRRLHLVIAGETEAEPSALVPEDPGNPGFDRTLRNTRLVNTELRYGVVRRPDVDLFLGVGVRLVLPLESFARTRFQYTRRLGDFALARIGETLFWKDRVGFGETTELELDRQLAPRTLLRWSNSGTVSEKSEGLDWGSELSLLQQFTARSAATLAAGLFGDTRPAAEVNSYRVLARYRRSVFREWIFVEVEPEVSWPRGASGGYHPAYASTFRVEAVFQGASAGREGKPGSGTP